MGLLCPSTAAFWAWSIGSAFAASQALGPTIYAAAGTFIGNTSIDNLDQFLGIPYAVPPIGNLRFSNPERVPTSTLQNPFMAMTYGPGCLQDPMFAFENGLSEDCLTLNIIRPSKITYYEPLPVLFFIHGGGNINGQSILYNGTSLVQFSIEIGKPVIYVICNYRLGGFGFLNSPDFQSQGLSNLGLKDQRLALEWVHENIASFGGDLDKTIIFGESAGAWNTQAQLHYAYSQNETDKLFQGMITQSGSIGGPGRPYIERADTGLLAYQGLLNATNCTHVLDSVACLRGVDISLLSPLLVDGNFGTTYTLDGDWFNTEPAEILSKYEFAPIPVIHGCNLNEGSVFLPDVFNPPNTTALIRYIGSILNDSLAEDVVNIYQSLPSSDLGKGYTADTTADHAFWTAASIYGDVYFHLARRAFLKTASKRVAAWGYSFNQQPPLSQMNFSYEIPGSSEGYAKRVGIQHGAELSYVFGDVSGLRDVTVGDIRVSTVIMRAWISFAYSLDPNAEGVPFWPRYNESIGGVALVLAEQGNMSSSAQVDTLRQKAYDAWNTALIYLGREPVY